MVSNDKKLRAIISTLTIMHPRMPAPYDHDVSECIKLCKEVRESIKEANNGNDTEGL